MGSLRAVRFSNESGVLIVTTALGILCQYDESAYAYRYVNGRWQRIWESEQNDYSPAKYNPQHIKAVHVLQSFRDGNLDAPVYVMSLGNSWGCTSTWHSVIYRVWLVSASGSKLLIDDSDLAWLRTGTYAIGSIVRGSTDAAPVDVLVEFTKRSIDLGVHNREAIRHYLIDGDRVRRIDPVALSPRDFVDEWLTSDWEEIGPWSASLASHRRA